MVCPNCGYPYVIGQCPGCGAAMTVRPALPAPKKRRKRWFLFATAIVFVLSIALGSLQMVNRSPYPWFRVEEGVLYFNEDRYEGGPVLTVPDIIGEETVTALSVGCFENVEGITTIRLPDTLTQIRERAFQGCTDLLGLEIPQQVTELGAGALRGCTSLEAISIPIGLHTIGEDALAECPTLLYVFYGGFYDFLQKMYPQEINPYVYAICLDGIYQFNVQSQLSP